MYHYLETYILIITSILMSIAKPDLQALHSTCPHSEFGTEVSCYFTPV
jgi:hypothetical protein